METVKCLYARNDVLRTAKHGVKGSSEISSEQNPAPHPPGAGITTAAAPFPNPFLQKVRSSASSFNVQCPPVALRSFSSF